MMLFALLVLLKLAALILLNAEGYPEFGGGNDSNFYHAYAVSDEVRSAPSIWPSILRFLNAVGLYSRESLSYMLQFIGVVVIPLLAANTCRTNQSYNSAYAPWGLAVLLSCYPVLLYYTLDIWREVFMLLCFLLGVFVVKKFIQKRNGISRAILSLLIFMLILLMYSLRPYLGFSFAMAFFGYGLIKINSKYLIVLIVFYFLLLEALFAVGLLDRLLLYNEMFEGMEGGTNLNVGFDNGLTLGFLRSFSQQMLGFFAGGGKAALLFIMETIPFLLAVLYITRNRKYSSSLVDFLVIFFIVYTSIFVIANANFGTGVRLRLFSYVSIYMSACIICQNKLFSLRFNKDAQSSSL